MYRKQFLTTVKSDESNRHKNYTSKIAAKVVKELNQTTASTEQSRIQNIQKDWRKKMGKQCNAWTVYQKYRLAADWWRCVPMAMEGIYESKTSVKERALQTRIIQDKYWKQKQIWIQTMSTIWRQNTPHYISTPSIAEKQCIKRHDRLWTQLSNYPILQRKENQVIILTF